MPRTSPVFYVLPSAISITPNANNSANDLAVYVARGTKIKVYSQGIAQLNFSDNTYQEWTLASRNRRLADITKPYTIYARLAKEDKSDGYLVFAPKVYEEGMWKDKYPYVTWTGLAKNTATATEEITSATDKYWWIKLGEVALPESGERSMDYDTGILGTDQFNSEWNLDPDDMPLRIEIDCSIEGEDAGPTPYVPWNKELILRARLVEGWADTDIERFHHWTIQRNTGDESADVSWPPEGRALGFGRTGNIVLSHSRNDNDDFNGSVSATFTVVAWGTEHEEESSSGVDSSSSSSSSSGTSSSSGSSASSENSVDSSSSVEEGHEDAVIVPIATATVTIMAETAEKYELELSTSIVSYDPTTDAYSPTDGIKVRIRATDQKGSVFKLTRGQLDSANLVVQYAIADTDEWTTLTFDNAIADIAEATIPISVFTTQRNINVRICRVISDSPSSDSSDSDSNSNIEPTLVEIYRTPIAFVRNGEDSKVREWIYLRSEKAISFIGDTESSDSSEESGNSQGTQLIPRLIPAGEVDPPGAALGIDTNKNQDGWVPEGWWDEMQGTDDTYHYEYGSYRDWIRESSSSASSNEQADSGDQAEQRIGHWGEFSKPTIWSYRAEDAITYRCRWTLAGNVVYQLIAAYTGAFRGTLPLVATLMKRTGNGPEEIVTADATIITVKCDGLPYQTTVSAQNPQFTISETVNPEFVSYLNNVALTGLTITFTIDGEEHTFSIPVIRDADEDSIKGTMAAYGEELFVSKVHDDVAAGMIRFTNERGVQFGEDFASGPTGFGGRIDGNADAELESLTLRRFLEVPELRYNRISIQVGNRWRAPGGGIILRVVPDEDSSGNILNTGTIYLHLEDGEIGKVAVDDICMGIYHDGMNTNDNDADDFDDSRGNFRFSGFFTTYFTVTRIVEESDNSVFEYALRDDEHYPASHHPCDMMHFVCYGNFTNPDRQSSRYSTLTYERYLYHVNTWEFSANNVAAQFGDLSNLSVYGLDMTGYSAYLNNIYMTGRLEQIRQLADELSSYSVDFSDYVDVITIDDVGNVIGGLYKVENNTPYDYRIHSAITVRKNSQVLTICAANEPVTTGKYKIYAEPVRCTYTLANSTIYITSIENIKDGIPGTPDDVNFDYDAMREMTNCYVNLTIDCEGKTTLVKQFPITIKHMSEPFVDADINNESSGVSWNTKTQAYIGLPIVFDLTMYHNNEVLDITSTTNVSLTTTTSGVTLTQTNGTAPSTIDPSTIYYSKTIETITKFAGTPNEVTFKVARISIIAMGKDIPLVTNIDVTGTAIYAGVPYERTLTHTINKSTDTNVYSLLPSVDEVVVSQDGSLSDNSLTCSVICDSSDDKHYTVSSSDFSKHNLALRYKRFYTDGTSDSSYQTYSGAVTVSSVMKKVAFYLFGTVNGSVSTSILHDTEEVPVIVNGVDGAGVEYVFWVQESWNGDSSSGMATPMIRDDSSLPAFQADNYEPYGRNSTTEPWTNTWKDEPIGVSGNVGYKYEFYAQRKKVNGVWQAFGDVHLWNKYTQSGSSPYVLDLSNDNSLINCDEDGTIIGTYETSEIMIFKGGRDAYNDFTVTITWENITATLSNRVITVSNMTAVGAQVNVRAVNNSDSSIVLTAVYSIRKVFPGDSTVIYSLQPSLQVIHKYGDNGGFIDTTISVQVKKSVGIDTTIITTPTEMATEGLKLCYVQGTGSTEHTFTNNMAAIATSTLCGNAAYTTIYLRDLETGQKMYDRERICTVSDGDTGNAGPMGLTGCRERVFEIYTQGMTYRNDENDDTITGVRYVDFIPEEDNRLESGYRVWMCKETHEALSATFAGDREANPTKWEPVSENAASAFFTYLIAKNAHFKFGSGNEFVIQDSNGTPVAGLTGAIVDADNEDESVRIWAGGSNPYTAPFRVLQDGQMFADKAHVKGLVEIRNANEGVMVYDGSGGLRAQIVGGEVTEPVNETITLNGSANAYATTGMEAFQVPTMLLSFSPQELVAGALLTPSVGIAMWHGQQGMKLLFGERLVATISLVTSNGNVIDTVTLVHDCELSEEDINDLSFAAKGFLVPTTGLYSLSVSVAVGMIRTSSSDGSFGSLVTGDQVGTSITAICLHRTPEGTRIGTNGLFVNMGSNKTFNITASKTEIKYGSYRIKIDNTGIYQYTSPSLGYLPMFKKVKTISSDYEILAEDGVLFLNNSSTINLTLTSDSSDEIKIISKSGVEYKLLGMPVVRSNGQAASPFTADDYRPRIFVKDTTASIPSWYELYCSN